MNAFIINESFKKNTLPTWSNLYNGYEIVIGKNYVK